jgi:hemerythrin-like domain-containing protein
MKPTEILSEEHRVIETVLAVLEKMADRLASDQELDTKSASEAIAFFRTFADECHHGKEEDFLFPMLEQKGFSREQGPTGVMFHEHDEGRRHVKAMAEAVDQLNSSTPESDQQTAAREQFAHHALAFVTLLREHIQKEDHCLFNMADQAFSESEQQELLQAFERVEHEHLGAGTHEKFIVIANALADRYGVARAQPSCGSCGHAHHPQDLPIVN